MLAKIITIEGIDKAGKNTQTKMLLAALLDRQIKTKVIEWPNRTNHTGVMIANLLYSRELVMPQLFHMLMSANRWEDKAHILDWFISENKVVIMNRYCESNYVYGACNKVNPKWLMNLDEGLPKSDLVIVLEVDAEISFDRQKEDRDNFEANLKMMQEAAKQYRGIGEPLHWKFVNADRDRDEVHKDIMELVEENVISQMRE